MASPAAAPIATSAPTLNQKPECDAWPSRWSQRINHDRPDVVLLIVGRWEIVDRMHEGRWTAIGDPAYDAYLRGELDRALDILGSTGARVVVTTEPYNRRGEKPDGSLYPEDDPDRVDDWNTLLRRVVGQRPNVTVLDLNKKLAPNGAYTTKVDGIRMRSDGVHPDPRGGRVDDALAGRRAALISAGGSLRKRRSVPESAAAQAQQQHRQVLAVGAELAVALDDLHLAAVHQPGAAGGDPGLADDPGNLGATFHCFQDRGVELVDLLAQVIDIRHAVGRDFNFDRHW